MTTLTVDRIALLLVVCASMATGTMAIANGRIIVAGDDWPFFDEGFTQAPDTTQFVKNVAAWFTGGDPGRFLSTKNFSATRGTGDVVVSVMKESGHSWTVNDDLDALGFDDLLVYDGLFLGDTEVIPDSDLLTSYVHAGGNVYLYGTGVGNDPTRWNDFLTEFGLRFGTPYSGKDVYTILDRTHPIFEDVTGLYFWDGVAIVDKAPLDARSQVFYTDRHGFGLFGIWAPDPATFQGPRLWSFRSGGNGHYYEHISNSLRWEDARVAASNRNFNGMPGYLATITSDAENRFISSLFPMTQNASWIGANDIEEESVWVWADGPESGDLISTFTEWDRNEPNNTNNEDAAGMWGPGSAGGPGAVGTWNDFATQDGLGYFVEFSPEASRDEEPGANQSPPTLLAFWDFNDVEIPRRASDHIGPYVGSLRNGLEFSDDAAGRTGMPGDRSLDFGTEIASRGFQSRNVARAVNLASRDQALSFSIWQKWNDAPFFGSNSFTVLTARGHAYRTHAPWGDGLIYFDGPLCRVSKNLSAYTTLNIEEFVKEWHHFVFVRSRHRSQVWVDGRLFIDEEIECTPTPEVAQVILGANQDFNHQMLAKIDDFAIFDEALNGNAISALANGVSPLLLAIPSPPEIIEHPLDMMVEWGSSPSLEVNAESSGSLPLQFQWYKDNSPIEGADRADLVLNTVSEGAAGMYRVSVLDLAGREVISRSAVLSVLPKPPIVITEHPPSATITGGESITLEIVARGSFPIEYQWFVNGRPISGATSSTLTIRNATVEDSGSYQVLVSDQSGERIGSQKGQLTVLPRLEPPPNDHFDQGEIIEDFGATVRGSNEAATRQESEPNHAGLIGGHSVWWNWTAPLDGVIKLSTKESGIDTILAVYTGSSYSEIQEVVSNDDNPHGGTYSEVTWQARSGTDYRIAVDSFGEQFGEIVLSLDFDPILPALNVTVSGRNLVLSWPRDSATFVIEGADSLENPQWERLEVVLAQSEGRFLAKVPLGQATQFFRLNVLE